MEEIVLGLSKSVVEGTLSKVRSAIEEEEKLKLTVQSDLVFITGEFEMMQSFLNVADAERIKNNAVKTWVRQLRDLAYDAEDCIELVVHLDPKPIWLRRFFARLLPCLPAVELPIDEAAAEIKQLKERVEYVSQRNMRYNLITEFGGTKSVAQQQLGRPADSTKAPDIPVKAITQKKEKKKGRLVADLAELISTKGDRRDLDVISVWGTGGDLGMTSIVRKAYDDPKICKSFKYRGWAKLSSTQPFKPRKILRSLLVQFCINTRQKQGTTLDVDSLLRMEAKVATHGELVKEFVSYVKDHRYLVVLEDISTIAEWDALRMYLPDMGNGSQIIVSTQHFDIASLCTGQPYNVSEFRKFTADHSVCVFFKEVSEGSRGSKSLCDGPQLIGRETQKHELISQIDEVSRVISVWGIAGVGKSSLVRAAYCQYLQDRPNLSQLDPNTSYIHGWVNVPHPFDLRDLCHSLILDLSSEPTRTKQMAESELENMSYPVDVCRGLLSNAHNECLTVIDDLQSAQEWDTINQELAFGPRCCIVVVTNEASVAKHCSRQNQLVFNVKGLDDEQAFQLFEQEYNKESNPIRLDEYRKKQARLILNKCGGLPKVMVAIGGFLAKELNLEAINKTFIHQLETNPELASVQSIFGWLDSYFHTCPDYLKPCIFYLSIFPRRQGIRRRRLVRRWIAEGYSRETDDNLAEVNGEMYFSRLANLSMLQQAPHGVAVGRRMTMCYINDFFREYIVSRRMEENHVFALEGSRSRTTRRTGRHLVIEGSWDRDKNVFDKVEFSRLRSLTVFGAWKPFFTSDKMRVLRVLDLEGTVEGLADDDIDNIVTRLPRLKFLSLRGCKDISRLPDSLGRLKQLETLDVRHTAIASLPATVDKLKKLQYVRAGAGSGTTPSQSARDTVSSSSRACTWVPACLSGPSGNGVIGVDVHRGIGKLTNLHTLGVINATVVGLKELLNLTQLRKLGVSGINPKNSKELWSLVSDHHHLESLSVWLDKDMHGHLRLDDMPQPPEKLERLKLHGHVHTDGELRIAFLVDSLKVLQISCSSKLHVSFQEGAVKNLTAHHFRCDGLSSLELSGLEHLNCVKEVLLEGSYGSDIEEGLQEQLDRHPNNPVLKQARATSLKLKDNS